MRRVETVEMPQATLRLRWNAPDGDVGRWAGRREGRGRHRSDVEKMGN